MNRDDTYLLNNKFAEGNLPNGTSFKKGHVPWNKGKTKIDDERIARQGAGATRFRKGQHSHNYKGGRIVSHGYILVLRRDHPRANSYGYVAEHILIWEEANNRSLPIGYVVHHLNGTKDDNRPENLVAMSRKGHSPALAVKIVQKRLCEVEAELAQSRSML